MIKQRDINQQLGHEVKEKSSSKSKSEGIKPQGQDLS